MTARKLHRDFSWTCDDDSASAVVALDDGWAVMLTFMPVQHETALVDLQLGYVGSLPDDSNAFLDWADRRRDGAEPVGQVPLGGITTKLIRGVNWGDLQRGARIRLADPRTGTPPWAFATKRRPTKTPTTTMEGLALLAEEYAAVAFNGEGVRTRTHPVAVLAQRHGTSRAHIANQIERARQAKLLTRQGQGRTGGTLTHKAKEILSGQHR